MNAINISLSALNSFGRVQEVIANDVANVNTPNYKAKEVILEEKFNNQGVRIQEIREEKREVSLGREDNEEEQIKRSENNHRVELQNSDVELEREFVQMIQNQNAYNANAQAVRVQNQMVGELINKIV